MSDDEFVQSGLIAAIKTASNLEKRIAELEAENADLREAKDAYFKHNNILVQLMTEEQKKKALDILIKPTEAQP